MKKGITIAIAVAMMFTCLFYVPNTETYAAAKAKYVKIKATTYNSMKKTIASQKKTIAARNKTITSQKTTIANQKATIAEQKTTIAERDATIKDKKQTISWLWDQLEAFGFEYNYDSHKWESSREPVPIEQIDMEDAEDVIPLLQEQTGLTIDVVEIVDSWKSWYCFYVQADGDLYIITMKNKVVDVISQVN